MNATRALIFSVGLIVGATGIARAADEPVDHAAYKQKMHDCATQMKADHPDMNHDARRKACHQQLGAAPKAPGAATPAAPAPTKP